MNQFHFSEFNQNPVYLILVDSGVGSYLGFKDKHIISEYSG